MTKKTKELINRRPMTPGEFSAADDMLLGSKQLRKLLSRTPPNHVYTRKGKGGRNFKYVTGIYVKKQLNFLFGWNWDFEVVEHIVNIECEQCIVLGRLTMRARGQVIVKMQFGRADVKFFKGTKKPVDLGNDLKAAATDALKKCASEFGICSDIYGEKEFREVKVADDPQPIQRMSGDEWNQLTKDLQKKLKACKTLDELTMLYSLDARYQQLDEFANMFEERRNELINN